MKSSADAGLIVPVAFAQTPSDGDWKTDVTTIDHPAKLVTSTNSATAVRMQDLRGEDPREKPTARIKRSKAV